MRALALIGIAIAVGCGRIGFEPRDDAGQNSAIDAALSSVAQHAYIKASNTGAGDTFGYSVALSADGSTLAVGARSEASAATGVGGNQADNSVVDAGAVYVYTRSGASWTPQAYVKSIATSPNGRFGVSVALAADGSTLAVGAYGELTGGAVYIFSRAGATWTFETQLLASNAGANDEFGYAVALAADGSTLAVGANREDSAATGIGGNQLDNTATDAGAVYIFTGAGTQWAQQAYVKASNTGAGDRFGVSVALSGDASTLAVGGFAEGSAATGIDGNGADNTAPLAGAAYLFTHVGNTWTQRAYVKASNTGGNDNLGISVALSRDGSTFAVGAYGEASTAVGIDGDQVSDAAANAGAVYVFERAGTSWAQQAYVKASNTGAADRFGVAIALSADGSTLAVGADRERGSATGVNGNQSDDSAMNAGAAYLFTRAISAWAQLAYIKASNTNAADGFGSSLALAADGSTLAIGAPDEGSSAMGVDGNEADNTATSAGAAYVFE